ncbi:hypothetical protein [Bacillus subtilis]|uniref:hypothetical protein n=1 Tax=Bacillus subtilis TaxID=1423 RepID=UPI00084A277D|nr:hypothetical protein [Bacillus subtilis]ODV47970.1 hypothetical protein BCM26_06065 [Bacillus subtilis]OJH63568.1 hypothetical protein BOH71_10010 [Bacillus subtilis]
MDKIDVYFDLVNKINETVLFQRLGEKKYRDEVIKLHIDAFVSVYGKNYVFPEETRETNGMVYLPTMFRSQLTQEEWFGLGEFNAENKGSLHSWILFHPEYKCIDSREFEEKLSSEEFNVLVPCDYFVLCSIVGGYKTENKVDNYVYKFDD